MTLTSYYTKIRRGKDDKTGTYHIYISIKKKKKRRKEKIKNKEVQIQNGII